MGRNIVNFSSVPQDIETERGLVTVPPGGIVEVKPRLAAQLIRRDWRWEPAPSGTPDEEKVWPEEVP